jgi:hypothetical protein
MKMTHVVTQMYIAERDLISEDLTIIAITLKQHEDVRKILNSYSMSILDVVIPLLSRKHDEKSSCDYDITTISITCYWIVCKFNIDHFGVSYKHVQNLTGIGWKNFVFIEKKILKILDYDLWKFMGEKICYEDPIASSWRPLLVQAPRIPNQTVGGEQDNRGEPRDDGAQIVEAQRDTQQEEETVV